MNDAGVGRAEGRTMTWVLIDGDGLAHLMLTHDYRLDRMCELREPIRCARPGEPAKATHVNCIRCVVEGAAYMQTMYGV